MKPYHKNPYFAIQRKLAEIARQLPKPRPPTQLPTHPPVYRGPEGEVWDGRGRVPQWIKDYEATGLSRAVWRIAP